MYKPNPPSFKALPPRKNIYCKIQTFVCPKVRVGKSICCIWCELRPGCPMVCDSVKMDMWRDCPMRCSRKEWITEKTYKEIFNPSTRADKLKLILAEMAEAFKTDG